ncbi:hypothetical protein DENSPDRAFT_839519 [Dentipellis sp. KUC8613]|nr:hypothetical protein DENSPDRAFT_839519 [Dentipellis sp. KUC8613]
MTATCVREIRKTQSLAEGGDKSLPDYKYSFHNSIRTPSRTHTVFLTAPATSPLLPTWSTPGYFSSIDHSALPLANQGRSEMPHDGQPSTDDIASKALNHPLSSTSMTSSSETLKNPLEWDWDVEHDDRKREAKADAAIHGAAPFLVDRKLLKDVVREKMDCEVARITFLGSGTFHKGYLVTLCDGREIIARVARRFMPRLKTESEVATLAYIRTHTSIPVPTIYFYDSNPYNRLGGEYMLMSKAKGVPLSTVFHSMSHNELVAFLNSLASIVIPLFAHRFSSIGSLYSTPQPVIADSHSASVWSSAAPTPTITSSFNVFNMPSLTPRSSTFTAQTPKPPSSLSPASTSDFHVGPIISWPFFGSSRGDLSHPAQINRGPWTSTHAYLHACAEREVEGVKLENEGKAAPHRLHLDPDEIHSSRHHQLRAVPGDKSDESDEWDWEDSEGEWEGPGDSMYRDYRRMQRTTFLVSHLTQREDRVREEMTRWMQMMEKLSSELGISGDKGEEFGLDLHDLSLENVFVDEHDHTKIACIIDWESTTTRPLWQCAHIPMFLQSSPFTARLFRTAVAGLADHAIHTASLKAKATATELATLAAEWLRYEALGAPLRLAHRCVEWDGWEEGLVESIVGPADQQDDWIREAKADAERGARSAIVGSAALHASHFSDDEDGDSPIASVDDILKPHGVKRKKRRGIPHTTAEEKEKEKLLASTGDFCGGRGGELGRRLEALLTVNGDGNGSIRRPRDWDSEHEKEYEAEAE